MRPCALTMVMLLAGAWWWADAAQAQEVVPAAEVLRPRTKLAVTISDFLTETETGAGGTSEEVIQQEEQTRVEGAVSFGYFLLSGDLDERAYLTDNTNVIQEDTRVENFRLDIVAIPIWKPYVGVSNFSLDTSLQDTVTGQTIISEESLKARFAGFTVVAPISDSFSPFIGAAEGELELTVELEVFGVELVRETYLTTSIFLEAGFEIVTEGGTIVSVAARRRTTPEVEGIQYDLGPGTYTSREARLQIPFGESSGIALGYSLVNSARLYKELSSFTIEEEQVFLEFGVGDGVHIALARGTTSRATDFFLPTPTESTETTTARTTVRVAFTF